MAVKRSVLILAILVVSSSNAFAKDYKAPKNATILQESELLEQVIGGTFVGGKFWAQYLEPPTNNPKKGNIRGKGRANKYGGTWSVYGPVMCFEYDHPHQAAFNDCYTISIKDENATWYSLDGNTYYDPAGRIKFLAGNPKEL